MMNSKFSGKKNYILTNERIRAEKVRCIDSDNNNIGVVATSEALRKAFDAGLDLVQISDGAGGIPICRIVDFGKYKFELSKKNKENAKKQRESIIKVKELKFKPSTEINDLQVKASKAMEFINDGDKVKVFVIFKGRELMHKQIGFDTLNTFIGLVSNAQLIQQPILQGKVLSVMLERKRES